MNLIANIEAILFVEAKPITISRLATILKATTAEVQQAITEELEFYIQKMQETGKDDWRMWAKQVEIAQDMLNKDKFNNQNQINIQIVTRNSDGSPAFRVQDVGDEYNPS